MAKTNGKDPFNVCLGEVLRDIRKKKIKQNQKTVGEKVGLTQVSVSKIESGDVGASVRLLYKYCELANIEPKQAIEQLDDALKK